MLKDLINFNFENYNKVTDCVEKINFSIVKVPSDSI